MLIISNNIHQTENKNTRLKKIKPPKTFEESEMVDKLEKNNNRRQKKKTCG